MSQQVPDVVRKYYDGVNSGAIDPDMFGEPFRFRGVTDEYDSAHEFLVEMEETLGSMKPSIDVLQAVVSASGQEVAIRGDLKTAALQMGECRFSEWFRIVDGKISEIYLYYDPTPWREYFAAQENDAH